MPGGVGGVAPRGAPLSGFIQDYRKATICSAIYAEIPKSIGGDPVIYETKTVFDPDAPENAY